MQNALTYRWLIAVLFAGLMSCFQVVDLYAQISTLQSTSRLKRLKYNNPDLLVDLGVGLGAWPLPMDFDNDGLTDLVVVCADVPYDGAFLFLNTGKKNKQTGMPVFAAGRKLGDARQFLRKDPTIDRAPNVRVSYVNGKPVIMSPGYAYPDFKNSAFRDPVKLSVDKNFMNFTDRDLRANQWEYVDFDGNGVYDLVVGLGHWGDYWNGKYDSSGLWTGGPLHGYVYVMINDGTNDNPSYREAKQLRTTDGREIDVFGWPSPVFGYFTSRDKPDLICGEFLDGFTFFKNIGTRQLPLFERGVSLMSACKRLTMDLCMIVPVAFDFNGDGFTDLIVGDEAGRVALIEHSGKVIDGVPDFLPPRYLKQEADEVKFGVLATPVGFDWNGDGRDDIISGNSEGQIGYIENLGGHPVRWAAPRLIEANGKPIRIMAGPNGSVQGPSEAKWGYTTVSVVDWDHDGRPDLLVNSIWGKVVWFKNTGTRKKPRLSAGQPVEVEWAGETPKPEWNWWNPAGKELVTQWRTTPVAIDWTEDGLTDIVMLDHEGYLALYTREKRGDALVLLPGKRVFQIDGEAKPFRMSDRTRGGSGRRKLTIADLDGDGLPDLLANGTNAVFYKNIGTTNGLTIFRDMEPVDGRVLAGHTTSPTVIDLEGDGKKEILIGAEDGFFYFMPNPFSDK